MKKKFTVISLIVFCIATLCIAAYYLYYYRNIKIESVQESGNFVNFRDTIPKQDTSRQKILLIGDSMAYSLMFRAQNYCDYNQHELKVVSWVSATSKTYAICDTLEYYVNLYKPTFIIFVIGANEMFAYNAQNRIQYFEKIIPQTHGIHTVWIGPPNWKEDTGINNVMMQKFGPKQFFLSKKLKYTRIAGDVAHPDRTSSSMWMDSIASWIMHKSYFPIKLEQPKGKNPIRVDFVRLVVKDSNKV